MIDWIIRKDQLPERNVRVLVLVPKGTADHPCKEGVHIATEIRRGDVGIGQGEGSREGGVGC